MSDDGLGALAYAVVQTIPTPVLVLDHALNVRAANRAFLEQADATLERIAGQHVTAVGNGQWNIPALADLLESLSPVHPLLQDYEVRQDVPGIGPRTLLLSARRLEQAEGEDELILVTSEDVTVQVQTVALRALERKELERSNVALTEFAYAASHDLQEPLRKVSTFTNRVLTQFGDALPSKGRDYLERASAATDRMRTLIEGLLACARLSTEVPAFTRVDLDLIAREVVVDLEHRIEELGASVTIAPLPVIDADRFQMRQLLQNLVENALKFHRPGVPAQVRVSASTKGGFVDLCVQDNGIGFDAEYAERIFGMFKRLHPRTAYPGSGIGLALCRVIVERHHGTISSVGRVDDGAMFTARLPLRRVLFHDDTP